MTAPITIEVAIRALDILLTKKAAAVLSEPGALRRLFSFWTVDTTEALERLHCIPLKLG